ncbi:MAG: Vitamin B12 dependent methionine synthase activation subunit [Clostridiales bacterium]|nr:Vitamin B12 dependent methionine synthase activation subunit [Clostridiales bacterium]
MNKAEILRYLRTSSKTDDEKLLSLIDECCNEVNDCVKPKTLHRIFDCTVTDSELKIGDTVFKSKRLAQNLNGCRKVCVFGATLGTECDRLLRTYAPTDITRTMVLQACLASKIEEVCDALENELKSQGYSLRQRYSPGYFDLDITENKKVFKLIDLTKRIGLTLTDTCQMVPTKSVTAFIGIEND